MNLEKRAVITVSLVLVLFLVTTAFYAVDVYLPSKNNQTPTTTPTPTPTPIPTPIPTPKPAPGVTSIDFTRWHPSGGENTIIIAYPTEKATIQDTNMSLKIYTASKSIYWSINSIYYTADWLGNDSHHAFSVANLFTDNIEVIINFHDIPDGYHTFPAYLSVHDYSKANVTVHFTTKTV